MIFTLAVCDLYSAHATVCSCYNCPSLFTVGINFLAVKIFSYLVTVAVKLKLSLEILAHCHKKLMVGQNIVLFDFTYCYTAGKGGAFFYFKIISEINGIAVVHSDLAFVVAYKGVVKEVENNGVDFFIGDFACFSAFTIGESTFEYRRKLTLTAAYMGIESSCKVNAFTFTAVKGDAVAGAVFYSFVNGYKLEFGVCL